MRVPVFGPHDLDRAVQHGSRCRLRNMEQRSESALLQLRFVQSRFAGELEAFMEESKRYTDRDGSGSDMGLSYCL